MPTPEELDLAQRVLDACGLRFDGYTYAESKITRGQDPAEWPHGFASLGLSTPSGSSLSRSTAVTSWKNQGFPLAAL